MISDTCPATQIGEIVWATRDLVKDPSTPGSKVLVQKRTYGLVLGPSTFEYDEARVSVEWYHASGNLKRPATDTMIVRSNVREDMISNKQTTHVGAFKIGQTVWATRDLVHRETDTIMVQKHTRGTVQGEATSNAKFTRVSVLWAHRTGEPRACNARLDIWPPNSNLANLVICDTTNTQQLFVH